MAIQQKFSFPVACFVFAIIGLALGLRWPATASSPASSSASP